MALNAKYSDILFKIFLTLIMSLIMSIVITLLNVGLVTNFPEKWAVAFAGGFIVSFPSVLIAVPVSRKIVGKITQKQAF